jgi:hypothetical protein
MKLTEDDDHTRNLDTLRTFEEVAAIMTERGFPMSAGAAWHTERRALRKIAREPELRGLAREFGLPERKEKHVTA